MKLLSLCFFLFLLIGPYAFSVPQAGTSEALFVSTSRGTKDIKEPAVDPTTSYTKTLNKKEYIGGAFASMFLGLGIGHAIQGRWMDEGWFFTLGEGVTLGVILSSFLKGPTSNYSSFDITERVLWEVHNWSAYISLALFVSLRVWASIDTWVLPSHIKVAQESRFQITPLVVSNYSNSNYLSLGLNMKYRF